MRRREIISALALSGFWPGRALGQPQPGRLPRIGFLYGGVAEALTLRVDAFVEGVRAGGRRDIDLMPRAAGAEPSRLQELARELSAEKLDILFVTGPAAVRAVHAVAPPTLPIVALDLETDPVETRLVASLARPGGNLTGIFFDFPDFSSKWLELLRSVLPTLIHLAIFWDPGTGPLQLHAVQSAVGSFGIEGRVIETESAR